MTNDRRKAYNQGHYAIQKKHNEELKRFKELFPERFAELQAQVKQEAQEHPIIKAPRTVTNIGTRLEVSDVPYALKYRPNGTERAWPLSTEELDEIMYRANERDVYIHCKGDHHYFETVPETATPKDIEEVMKRHLNHEAIISFELCNCPACIKRHGYSS